MGKKTFRVIPKMPLPAATCYQLKWYCLWHSAISAPILAFCRLNLCRFALRYWNHTYAPTAAHNMLFGLEINASFRDFNLLTRFVIFGLE
jgi:hypothetical protein